MRAYLELLREALDTGVVRDDRTGVGVRSLFGRQIRFDLRDGFPLVTTKRLHLKSIVHELIWFLNGDANIGYLKANGVSIWDDWADENGDLATRVNTFVETKKELESRVATVTEQFSKLATIRSDIAGLFDKLSNAADTSSN